VFEAEIYHKYTMTLQREAYFKRSPKSSLEENKTKIYLQNIALQGS
jgi:hypothetical protein